MHLINIVLCYSTELRGKYEMLVPTLSLKMKRIEDLSPAVLDNLKVSHSLKRRADDAKNQESRKRARPDATHIENRTKRESSNVISDENSTSVERYTTSGRRVKIVCYRKLIDGEINRNGEVTTRPLKQMYTSPKRKSTKMDTSLQSKSTGSESIAQSPSVKLSKSRQITSESPNVNVYSSPQSKPTKSESPSRSRSTNYESPSKSRLTHSERLPRCKSKKFQTPQKPESKDPETRSPFKFKSSKLETVAPSSVNKSPEEKKLESIKKIGRIRALQDNEITDLLDSDDEDKDSNSDDEDSGEEEEENSEIEVIKTAPSNRNRKTPALDREEDSNPSKTTSLSKSVSKKPESCLDCVKDCPLPKFTTEKGTQEKPKSKSTVKKRFKCKECCESFTSRRELRDHEEDHEDFRPVSKTPSR